MKNNSTKTMQTKRGTHVDILKKLFLFSWNYVHQIEENTQTLMLNIS